MPTMWQLIVFFLVAITSTKLSHAATRPVYLIVRLDNMLHEREVLVPRCLPSTVAMGCSLNPLFLLSKEAPPPLSTAARRLVWGAGQDYQCSLHANKANCIGDTSNRCQWLLGQCTSADDYLWSCPGSQADIFYKCQNNNLDVQLLDFEDPTCPPSPDCVPTGSESLPCNAKFLMDASATQQDVFWKAKANAEAGTSFDSHLAGCCESSIVFRQLAARRCKHQTTEVGCRATAGCKPFYSPTGTMVLCSADGLPLPKEEVLSTLLATSKQLGHAVAAANAVCKGLQDCSTAGDIQLQPDNLRMYQGPWNEPASLRCRDASRFPPS